jgi:hypothetical protein
VSVLWDRACPASVVEFAGLDVEDGISLLALRMASSCNRGRLNTTARMASMPTTNETKTAGLRHSAWLPCEVPSRISGPKECPRGRWPGSLYGRGLLRSR